MDFKSLTNRITNALLVALPTSLVLFSTPFLRLPYDPWVHLIFIRRAFDTHTACGWDFWPGNATPYPQAWHRTWALLFRLLKIDNPLTWATIIHYSQAVFATLAMIYASKAILKSLVAGLNSRTYLSAAILSTLLWLIGNGTFSAEYQQSWMTWYSITAQGICLPLYWVSLALLMELAFTRINKGTFWRISVVLLINVIILFAHPLELAYSLLALTLLFVINVRRFSHWLNWKRFIITCLAALPLSLLFYHLILLKLPNLQRGFHWQALLRTITNIGAMVVQTNRLESVFSEIVPISIILFLIMTAFVLVGYSKNKTDFKSQIPINLKGMTFLLIIAVTFFLIPSLEITAGITAYLIQFDLVWRFFFAVPWFLLLPFGLIWCIRAFNLSKKSGTLLVSGTGILTLLISFGWANQREQPILFNNLRSLNLMPQTVDRTFQYSDSQLANLQGTLKKAVGDHKTTTPVLSIRGDLGFIAAASWGYRIFQKKTEVQNPRHFEPKSDLIIIPDRDLAQLPVSESTLRVFPEIKTHND